jgi:actin-related protein
VVYDGFLVDIASKKAPIAGEVVTEYLANKLLPKIGVEFNTTAEKDQANDIKEAICYVRESEKAESKGSMSY